MKNKSGFFNRRALLGFFLVLVAALLALAALELHAAEHVERARAVRRLLGRQARQPERAVELAGVEHVARFGDEIVDAVVVDRLVDFRLRLRRRGDARLQVGRRLSVPHGHGKRAVEDSHGQRQRNPRAAGARVRASRLHGSGDHGLGPNSRAARRLRRSNQEARTESVQGILS